MQQRQAASLETGKKWTLRTKQSQIASCKKSKGYKDRSKHGQGVRESVTIQVLALLD